MEIHIVSAHNAHLYRDLLDVNFRLRKQIFIDELQWSGLTARGDLEFDQFDTEHAVYYFALEEGQLLGSIRRHCSLQPTLLSDIFPQLAERGYERRWDVYESTRQYVIPERRRDHPCQVAGYLQRALWGHSLREGARFVNFVTASWYVPILQRSGLRLKPLGLPTKHEDMTLVAVSSPVNDTVLNGLTAFYELGSAPFIETGVQGAPRQAA